MAIYKPSNLGPNLEEIDVTLQQGDKANNWKANIFEAQVNTTGENVLAYRLSILENNTEKIVYEDTTGVSLPKKSTNRFGKDGVKNKDFVKTYFDPDTDEYASTKNFIVNNINCPGLRNGKDYQWSIRMYDAPLGNLNQPITKVCDGFLVGTTHYVIWVKPTSQAQNNLLLYDRYVEFTPTTSNTHPIIDDNEKDVDFKVERVQIDWVEKELGQNKDITKIELVDGLKHNYIDGASFQIYLCDNKHTLTSAYADPNSSINASMFMLRYPNIVGAQAAPAEFGLEEKPANSIDCRRIIGTSTVTGELRVQEPFTSIPVNGEYYVLYELNRVDKKYTKVEGQTITNQKIGGNPQGTLTVMSNVWNSSTHRLFIQPNINIKSDISNPNEIVFDINGVRVDIGRHYDSVNQKDLTFNKLDNTQWLLEGTSYITAVASTGEATATSTAYNHVPSATDNYVPIIPGSIYTVYTDFMDCMPNGVFYARKTPVITMNYHNWNGDVSEVYMPIVEEEKPWRDIEFKAEWESVNNTQIKYYRYTLYDKDGNVIAESEDKYDTDLYWSFRGFQTDPNDPQVTPVGYTIELLVVDELNKEFVERRKFNILYATEKAVTDLEVEYDCDKQAFKVTAETPLYAIQDHQGKNNVNLGDIDEREDIVKIPYNKELKYNEAMSVGYPNIILVKPFSYITQFRLTKNFIQSIPPGGEKIITEIAVQKNRNDVTKGYDKYTFTISSLVNFFINEETNVITKNENRLKMKWYKNDNPTPLSCFNDGSSNFYDIVKNDPNQNILVPDEFAFVLQPSTDKDNWGYFYRIVDTLPTVGLSYIRYVLNEDYIYNGITYKKGGIFIYELDSSGNGHWKQIADKEFLFVDTLEQVPGYTYDTLSAPNNTRYSDNNRLLYTDTSNLWLDDYNVSADTGMESLTNKWFMLYLTVDLDENDPNLDIVRSYIEMNDTRVVK